MSMLGCPNLVAHATIGPVVLHGDVYQIPPGGTASRGTVVAASELAPSLQFPQAHRWSILYHSLNSHNNDTVVSGTVLIPRTHPPIAGWPLISWGHGTTGIADRCAPSERADLGYPDYAQEIAHFLSIGYAVAATDYIGLGTPHTHTYMNPIDQGNAVADIALAAHNFFPHISKNWFAVGHSQGGAAAIESTRAGKNGALPEGLQAAVALSPGTLPTIESNDPQHDQSERPWLNHMIKVMKSRAGLNNRFYMSLVALGMHATDSRTALTDFFTPSGLAFVPQLLNSACLFDPPSIPHLDVDSFIYSIPVLTKMSHYLSPDAHKANGPILVIQGTDDTDVPINFTRVTVQKLISQGSTVTFQEIPHIDHDGILPISLRHVLHFLADHGGIKYP